MTNSSDDIIFNRFQSWKVMYYSERLKQIANSGLTKPVTAHLYPTNRCTHDCSFCIMKKDRAGREMIKDLNPIIRQLAGMGVKCVHFSGGGEPMMHRQTTEAIQLAKDYKMTTVVSTNGTCGIPDADHIRISLNAGTKKTHEKIMQRKTWDTIIRNIRDCKERKKIGIGFVLTDENYNDIYEACRLAYDFGLNFIHIRPAFLPKKDKLIQGIVSKAIKQTEKAKKDFKTLNIYSIKEKFDGYWTERKYDKCLATPMNIVIKANGTLIPCQDRMDLEFGNIYEQTLKEIWDSKEHEDILNKINIDKCPRCVMTKVNEIIQNVYVDNKTINELI